ncbi:MAG: hypothetical protein F9B45_32470 [Phycisphaera sp. RhM]|nr:hypothetical protein [Phycisphaera sp. RhM]
MDEPQYQVGDSVLICGGLNASKTGAIAAADLNNRRLTVAVEWFSSTMDVNVAFDDVCLLSPTRRPIIDDILKSVHAVFAQRCENQTSFRVNHHVAANSNPLGRERGDHRRSLCLIADERRISISVRNRFGCLIQRHAIVTKKSSFVGLTENFHTGKLENKNGTRRAKPWPLRSDCDHDTGP